MAESASIFLELVGILGAWVLVVFGWMIVSDQDEQRELSKSAYSRVLEVRKILKETADLATRHHTEGFDGLRQREMVRNVGRIAAELSHLRRTGFVRDQITKLVIDFRRAVSFENESAFSYQIKLIGSGFVETIDTTTDALDRELMAACHGTIVKRRSFRESVKEAIKRF